MTYNAPESASADATGQVGGGVGRRLGEGTTVDIVNGDSAPPDGVEKRAGDRGLSPNDKPLLAPLAKGMSQSDTPLTAPPAAGKTGDDSTRFPAHPDEETGNNVTRFSHLTVAAAAGKKVANSDSFPAHPDHKAISNREGFPHLTRTAAAGKNSDNITRFPAHPDPNPPTISGGFPHLTCTAEHEFETMFLRDGLSPAQASGLAAAIAGLASMMAQEAVAALLGRMLVTRAGTALALAVMPELETLRDAAARLKMSRSTLADEVARMREVMRGGRV